MQIFIYSLKSPEDIVRYVGKTNNIRKRFNNHIRKAKEGDNKHLYCWIRELLAKNELPKIEILEICDENTWQEKEIQWIATFENLCNHTKGGEGAGFGHKNCLGRVYKPETIEKFKNAYKIRKEKRDLKINFKKGHKINNKRCLHISSNTQFDSLKEGCKEMNLKYRKEVLRIFHNSKKANFKYLQNKSI